MASSRNSHHGQVHNAVLIQPKVHRAAPVLGRGRRHNVVFAVGLLFHEGDHEIGGGAQKMG